MDNLQGSPKISVKMLGGFTVRMGDQMLYEADGRTKKVWMLIEYLIANRSHDISQEKLIEALWDDEECDAPFNALKNLVYRARKQLAELCPGKKVEFIRFVRNTYSWNNSLDCEVDIEEFERYYHLASDSKYAAEEHIENYNKAINLYHGEFLPKSSYVNWVVSKSAYYMSLYNESVEQVSLLLMDCDRYDNIIHICEKAVSIYPFEESIHKLLLFAYMKAGKVNKALSHYEYITDLFYKELNVNISDSFRDIYKQLVKGVSTVETDLNIIKDDLKEACDQSGAFYCDYDIFKNIYRLQARSMQRTGQSIHVALITLSDKSGQIPREEVLKVIMPQLKDCIVHSLRKGDTVSMYSAAQYVIILPLTTVEGGEIVMRRIVTRFNQMYKKTNLMLNTRLNAVDPI